jgi:hypothetical protein
MKPFALRRSALAFAACASLALTMLAPISARADFVPSLNYGSGQVGPYTGPGTIGAVFTVGGTAITIDALGLDNSTIGPGGTVRIYQFGTTTDLVTQLITSADPTSVTDPRFHYHTLGSPLTLAANTQYVVVMDINNQNGTFLDTPVTTDPRITYNFGVNFVGATGAHPTADQQNLAPYIDATFEIAPVPAPAGLILFSIGAAGLLGYAWRRRQTTVPVA